MQAKRTITPPPAGGSVMRNALQLPATIMGIGPAIERLAAGAAGVYCLVPDWFEGAQRRVPDMYIRRAAARAGIRVSIQWQWCREDEDGDGETVFRVTLR